ncbi:uncharacterized protein LOC144922801 [Branchiostoma floridae x Branchiostoma belcheri]
MVQFQATLKVPGSDHVSIASVQTWVEVARMPVTYTVGPVQRTIDTTSDLTVNAALSYDPEGILSSSGFLYDWKCSYEATLSLDTSMINIATCKKATSSSVGHVGVPERAIDGDHGNGQWDSGSCIVTLSESNPWWMVDLGTQYPIERIVLYNRLDGCCSDRLSPSNIHIGNTPVLINNPIVGNLNYVVGKLMYELVVGGVLGRYAGISLPTVQKLNFCEFEVYTNEAALLSDPDCEIVLGCLDQTAPNGERTFTTSLMSYDRPLGIIAHISVNVTAGSLPKTSLHQMIHVVPDESLSGMYLDCTENCNQRSTFAALPLVLDTTSEIQGTIEYSLVEYPAGHAAENWASVIEVSDSTLRVQPEVFVDAGYYTIRLTDTVGIWKKISEWRFQVLPRPSPGSGSEQTAEGDLQDLSGMCTLLPAAGTALIDRFCVTCQEFVDISGPLETQVTFELEPLAEIATVTFPGHQEPTLNEVVLKTFTGWINLPTMEQLQMYLDGFMTYPAGTFYSLIQRGEPRTAFLGSAISSFAASHIAASYSGEDITETVDMMVAGLSKVQNIQDMETVNGMSLSLLMLTALPEMVSGKTQVLSAKLLYECFKYTRKLSANATGMTTEEVNKAAALIFTGVVNVFKASERMALSEHLEKGSFTDNLQYVSIEHS